jgi:hypothetical protein
MAIFNSKLFVYQRVYIYIYKQPTTMYLQIPNHMVDTIEIPCLDKLIEIPKIDFGSPEKMGVS